jgi:predicted DNA-binding transcriptional regulator YafY
MIHDMELDVTSRALRLLSLLQSRAEWPAADLCERTGSSPRTLRRDLQRLASLGYEITSKPGPGGHYRLAQGTRIPPMVFDDDEVVALVAGLRAVEQGPAAEAASRALAKLRQVLPPRLASLATDVAAHTETLVLDETATADLLGPLTAAASAGLEVRFSYTDQHGFHSDRQLDSVRCLFVRGRWYVLGFDRGRVDWRLFRLERIHDVTSGSTAPKRALPSDDLASWLLTDFGRQVG